MNMIKAVSVFLITVSSTLVASPIMAADDNGEWRAYVCRISDWKDCEKNKNNKRIFPRPGEHYSDKETCLEEFDKLFWEDPEIHAKYPQVEDAEKSWLFACTQDKPAN